MEKQAFLYQLGRRLLFRLPYREMENMLRDYAEFPMEEMGASPAAVVAALEGKPSTLCKRFLALGGGLTLLTACILLTTGTGGSVFYALASLPRTALGIALLLPPILFTVMGGRKLLLLQQIQGVGLSGREKGRLAVLAAAALIPGVLLVLVAVTERYELARFTVGLFALSLWCIALCIPALVYLTYTRSVAYFWPLCGCYLLFLAGREVSELLHMMSDPSSVLLILAEICGVFAVGVVTIAGFFLFLSKGVKLWLSEKN